MAGPGVPRACASQQGDQRPPALLAHRGCDGASAQAWVCVCTLGAGALWNLATSILVVPEAA